ncbi:alcohol-forming fatty acyl-CoA reductase-like [Gossypium australe]|uniref:Alcohol-forming fatty acyl-CoA reductase-like n=1 Tax=Gossypium australe TaxID=47621 RepID=A0A5B6WIB6_9ROSI|nr:alcohol-forming fatty acyl-CoA reductase-like [Gossypium australe]
MVWPEAVTVLAELVRVDKIYRWVPLEIQSNVISTLVAEKLVRKGCEAYISFVSDSGSVKLSVKDIRTVRDFLDVFPNELPYCSSVNCSLSNGSKGAYELLDQGFIRLSVSL